MTLTSGIFFRAKRKGKYENVLIEDLTEDEFKEKYQDRGDEFTLNTIRLLCKTIREHRTPEEADIAATACESCDRFISPDDVLYGAENVPFCKECFNALKEGK